MINDVINFLPDNFHICLMTVFFLPKQSRLICEVQHDRWSFNPYYITQSARSAIRDLMDGSLILKKCSESTSIQSHRIPQTAQPEWSPGSRGARLPQQTECQLMYRGDLMPCCHGDLSTGVDINFDALHKYEGKITVRYKETNNHIQDRKPNKSPFQICL